MEDAYSILGGVPIRGSVRVSGAKNVALKAIIAALLMEKKVTLRNVPHIRDVEELLHLIKKLGVKTKHSEEHVLQIDPTTLSKNRVDLLHASTIRVSFMLFAPLLHKFGKCFIPNPGGCRLGERPIGRIIQGMRKLGVAVEYNSATGYYEATMNQNPIGTYEFKKPSHTGTELLIMLAAIGDQTIVIKNAAEEPEIDDLIRFLTESGAKIERQGTVITITGVPQLEQKKPFTIPGDRNEAITFAILGVATKGEITVYGIDRSSIKTFIDYMKKAGAGVAQVNGHRTTFYYKGPIKPVDVVTSPQPGFMTDWQPGWAVLMTQATGTSMIHERVFENRFAYVDELKKLGADIEAKEVIVKDPKNFYFFNYDLRRKYMQAITIKGGHQLHGGVLKIADLRAGASSVLAALVAENESIITGASILERGYEHFVEKVSALRGQITKL